MNQLDVLCVGIACVDTIVKGFDLDVFIKDYDETHRVDKIIKTIGGDAANQAINLKKLSNNVNIICGVGDDDNGNFIKNMLEEKGISLDTVLTYNNYFTSQAIALVDNSGQRRFISPKTNQDLPYYIKSNMIISAKVVSLGSIGSLPFRNIKNILITTNAAKQNGSIVCADVICSSWLTELSQIKEVLYQIDYIFPNMEEASKLTNEIKLSNIANKFIEKGVKNVVIKLGKKGCFFKNKDQEFIVPGVKNINVIDTTGAGDSFVSGFITGLINYKSNLDCCIFANAVAAVNIQHIGTSELNYDKDIINQYMNYIRNEERNEKY